MVGDAVPVERELGLLQAVVARPDPEAADVRLELVRRERSARRDDVAVLEIDRRARERLEAAVVVGRLVGERQVGAPADLAGDDAVERRNGERDGAPVVEVDVVLHRKPQAGRHVARIDAGGELARRTTDRLHAEVPELRPQRFAVLAAEGVAITE
jgi:hypothetical protein